MTTHIHDPHGIVNYSITSADKLYPGDGGTARVTQEHELTFGALAAEMARWKRHEDESRYTMASLDAPNANVHVTEQDDPERSGHLTVNLHGVTSIQVHEPGINSCGQVEIRYGDGQACSIILFPAKGELRPVEPMRHQFIDPDPTPAHGIER